MKGNISKSAKLFKALGNERRLAIIKLLGINPDKEMAVNEIAEAINLSIKSTSKHLRILESSGLLGRKQVSINGLYSVAFEDKNLKIYFNKLGIF